MLLGSSGGFPDLMILMVLQNSALCYYLPRGHVRIAHHLESLTLIDEMYTSEKQCTAAFACLIISCEAYQIAK